MTSLEYGRQLNAQAAAFTLLGTLAHRNVEGADYGDALRLLRLADVASKQLQQAVVDAMREEGATWDQVAAAMGVSKQSANARFNTRRKATR